MGTESAVVKTSTKEMLRYVGTWFAPPSTPDFLGVVGLNLALSLITSFAVVKLHDWDLHAVGWGEGPWVLVTPVKAIRVGVGFKKQYQALYLKHGSHKSQVTATVAVG